MPRSYKKLWHQKIAFTSTGDRKLPFLDVLYLEDAIVFLASLPLMWLLSTFTPLAVLRLLAPRWAVTILLSFAAVYATRKLDPAGKPLPKYLWSAVRYLFRGHLYHDQTILPRKFGRRRGRVHEVSRRARVAWTKGHLPLPVEVVADSVDVVLHRAVDVEFRKDGVRFRPASGLRLPSKRRWYGVKAGAYRYEKGKFTPRR